MDEFRTEAVERALIEIVEDLVQEWGLELDEAISGKTMLVADLEFESVDVIQLCVAIEEHYECKMKYQNLLIENGSYVSDLSIAQMTEFTSKKLKNEAL